MLIRTHGCGYRIDKRTEIAVMIAVIVAPDCALVREKDCSRGPGWPRFKVEPCEVDEGTDPLKLLGAAQAWEPPIQLVWLRGCE